MQFTVSFELYIDIGTRYIPKMETYLYHWNQNRNNAENKWTLPQMDKEEATFFS